MSGEIGFVPGSQTATIDEDSVSPTAVLKVQRTKATFGEVQVCSIKHEKAVFATFPNTEKRVENTTRSGVLLTKFEGFGNVVKLELKLRRKRRITIDKIYDN